MMAVRVYLPERWPLEQRKLVLVLDRISGDGDNALRGPPGVLAAAAALARHFTSINR